MAIIINTFSGQAIDLERFRPEHVNLIDIAVSLSRQRRYAGHTAIPWSVGQHTILCGMMCTEFGFDNGITKAAVLHDAEEYLVQDIINPIKRNLTLSKYDKLSHRTSEKIYEFFGLLDEFNNSTTKKAVSAIDQAAYHFEASHMVANYKYDASTFDSPTNEIIVNLTERGFSIPVDLMEMSDTDVAQNLLEVLQVYDAENKMGTISAEINDETVQNTSFTTIGRG